MKDKLFCLLLATNIHAVLNAQTQSVNALKIGEKVPDIIFPMLNYTTDSISLSDLKGKLIILDFWSTYCSACIAQFPRFDSLQQEFKNTIVILPVGFDGFDSGAIKEFIVKRKGTSRELKLPSAVQHPNDTLLMNLFPFNGLPNEVWIDRNGALRAVTDQFAVNKENIQAMLSDENIKLPMKYTDPSFDGSKPFLVNNNGGADSAFLFRSLITPYIPGIRLGSAEQENDRYVRVAIGNQLPIVAIKEVISNIYKNTPSRENFFPNPLNKRVVIESNNPLLKTDWNLIDKMNSSELENLRETNFYNYETIMPSSTSLQHVYQTMLSNIESFFGIKVSLEKRNIKCLVLSCAYCQEKLKSASVKYETSYSEDNLSFKVTNGSINDLILYLNNFLNIDYVIDEADYNGNIDIDIQLKSVRDLTELINLLQHYGLKLTTADREVEVLIVRDTNK